MSGVALERTSVGADTEAGRRRGLPWWVDLPALGGWSLGFALIVVLGLSGGGYDAVVRGEAGIAAWWIAGAGVALGSLALPHRGIALYAVAAFAALTVWTALGLSWTGSTERTTAEIARTCGYLGMFVLSVLICVRTPARHIVGGVATGLVVIGGYALLTRLQPDWFETYALNDIFPMARRRLAQPVGYWNALAGLLAIGVPLLLFYATTGRRIVTRAAAAAAVPVLVVAVFLTVSRGGTVAVGAAVAVWLVLAPDRLPKIPVLATVAVGAAVGCLAADDLNALQAGVDTALAEQQGAHLQTTLLLVMGGVAAVVAGIGLLERHTERPSVSRVSRRTAARLSAAGVIVAAVAALAVGGAGWAGDRIDEFKSQSATPTNYENSVSRLSSVSGNGRYQYWVAAREAQRAEPLTGIGPGMFEFLWAKENPVQGGFVRDAHSLWAEALGEMGLVGFLLVVGFFGMALAAGASRALRARDHEHRGAMGAATAGLLAFCVIASVEWAWEMTVLGAAGVVLAAICVGGRGDEPLHVGRAAGWRPARAPQRLAVGVIAAVAVAVIAVPTSTAAGLRDSQSAARAGRLDAAYREARAAVDARPRSAAALLQEALVLEKGGALERARAVAIRATDAEPVNWRTWLVRSRLDARLGDAAASVSAYRRARALNPRSPLFRR